MDISTIRSQVIEPRFSNRFTVSVVNDDSEDAALFCKLVRSITRPTLRGNSTIIHLWEDEDGKFERFLRGRLSQPFDLLVEGVKSLLREDGNTEVRRTPMYWLRGCKILAHNAGTLSYDKVEPIEHRLTVTYDSVEFPEPAAT